jgi:hypothetical protein
VRWRVASTRPGNRPASAWRARRRQVPPIHERRESARVALIAGRWACVALSRAVQPPTLRSDLHGLLGNAFDEQLAKAIRQIRRHETFCRLHKSIEFPPQRL